MEEQRASSRSDQEMQSKANNNGVGGFTGSSGSDHLQDWQNQGVTSRFVGHTELPSSSYLHTCDASIVAASLSAHQSRSSSSSSSMGEEVYVDVVIDHCPFYAVGGGQVGDTGYLTINANTQDDDTNAQACSVEVVDTLRPFDNVAVLRVKWSPNDNETAEWNEVLKAGASVTAAAVDKNRRAMISTHHTATHLLHAALKAVVGMDTGDSHSGHKSSEGNNGNINGAIVNQAGSLVNDQMLRFDFTLIGGGGGASAGDNADSTAKKKKKKTKKKKKGSGNQASAQTSVNKLTLEQLQRVEDWVNSAALASVDLQHTEMSMEEAEAKNAVAMFDEKYGEVVKVSACTW